MQQSIINHQQATLIAILGAGQLGRMLAMAAVPLGLHTRFLDPAQESPAARLGPHIAAAYDDTHALAALAQDASVVTYEFENVPVETVRMLKQYCPVYPPPQALEIAQDRITEKRFFQSLGIATPPFAAVDDRASLEAAIAQLGLPAVLKTRRMGYDGKGQLVLRSVEHIESAWQQLGAAQGQAGLILEAFVSFSRELSILAARGRDGSSACYPLIENSHREGILHRSVAPAPNLTPALQALAESYAQRVLHALDYVGILAIELFQQGDQLLVNEMAPRVHNSGHLTIEGAETSQFEQHLRAILGLPLGSTNMRAHTAMLNIIGTPVDAAQLLSVPGAHLHLYEKLARPGRKLGHITICANTAQQLTERLERVMLHAKW